MSMKDTLEDLQSKLSREGQVKILVFTGLLLLLFAPVLLKLARGWYQDGDYSHGFFVIPISLFMVWQKRGIFLAERPNPSWFGLVVLALSLAAYYVSTVTRFNTLLHLSMMTTIFGMLLFLGGWRITKQLILPVLFLLFMFPIPNAYYILITNPLKLMITEVSAELIYLMGIPVHQDGNILFLANTQLEVAEACSGIRSLYSYLMLGCLFALMTKSSVSKAILIFSTLPLALLVNVARVTVTGILSNYYGSQVAQGFFHEFSGFALFGLGFVILFVEYYLLQKRAVAGSGNPEAG